MIGQRLEEKGEALSASLLARIVHGLVTHFAGEHEIMVRVDHRIVTKTTSKPHVPAATLVNEHVSRLIELWVFVLAHRTSRVSRTEVLNVILVEVDELHLRTVTVTSYTEAFMTSDCFVHALSEVEGMSDDQKATFETARCKREDQHAPHFHQKRSCFLFLSGLISPFGSRGATAFLVCFCSAVSNTPSKKCLNSTK